MSKEAIKGLIDRAIQDPEFARQLKEDPEQAIQSYDLTTEEQQGFRSMEGGQAERFAAMLDRRIVKTDSDVKADDDPDDWWIGSVTD